MADNDLAVGRAVEAISHSPFWDDTAFFILEDDAQDGGGPRGCASQPGAGDQQICAARRRMAAPFVDSRFYSTVSVVRTMESLLGLPPMNNNDAFSSLISTLFTGPGDQPPFAADYVESRQRADLYGECEDGGGREGEHEDGLHATRTAPMRRS